MGGAVAIVVPEGPDGVAAVLVLVEPGGSVGVSDRLASSATTTTATRANPHTITQSTRPERAGSGGTWARGTAVAGTAGAGTGAGATSGRGATSTTGGGAGLAGSGSGMRSGAGMGASKMAARSPTGGSLAGWGRTLTGAWRSGAWTVGASSAGSGSAGAPGAERRTGGSWLERRWPISMSTEISSSPAPRRTRARAGAGGGSASEYRSAPAARLLHLGGDGAGAEEERGDLDLVLGQIGDVVHGGCGVGGAELGAGEDADGDAVGHVVLAAVGDDRPADVGAVEDGGDPRGDGGHLAEGGVVVVGDDDAPGLGGAARHPGGPHRALAGLGEIGEAGDVGLEHALDRARVLLRAVDVGAVPLGRLGGARAPWPVETATADSMSVE